MHATVHAIAGAAAGGLTKNATTAIAVGLASHVLLDATPHFDAGTIHSAFADGIAALGVAALLLVKGNKRVIWGAVAAAAPDLEIAAIRLGFWQSAYFPSHSGLVIHGHAPPFPGTIGQLAIAGLSFECVW